MRILAIETSCDETAVSVLECSGNTTTLSFDTLGTGLYSQTKEHAPYGGVFPNLAKREHAKNLIPLLMTALERASMFERAASPISDEIARGVKKILEREDVLSDLFIQHIPTMQKPSIDAIAVTQGPGLEPALWVGLNFAKALSLVWNVPLIPVNHMEGHVFSVLHENAHDVVVFPALAVLLSGGHTELVLVRDWLLYERLGETRDDAVGEAFDKVARLMGLPYPGGPEISRLAEESRRGAETEPVSLPRPMINSDDYDFSFSGLKTAVRNVIQGNESLSDTFKRSLAREFEDAVTDVIVAKTKRAIDEFGAQTLIVGGGVVANVHIREALEHLAQKENGRVRLLLPTRELSTDNAVMIGMAGYIRYTKTPERYAPYNPTTDTLRAAGTLRLETTQ